MSNVEKADNVEW